MMWHVNIRWEKSSRKYGNVWPPCYDWYNDQFFLGWDNLCENDKFWKCKNVELCDHGHGYWRGLIQFQKRPAPDNDIDTDRNVGMMMIRALMMMVTKMLMMMMWCNCSVGGKHVCLNQLSSLLAQPDRLLHHDHHLHHYTDGDHNDPCLQLTWQTNRQTDS